MAQIFFAYHTMDRDLARLLEAGLAERGHQSVWGVDELLAGRGWGELMPTRLAAADAVVAILSENSENAPSVWAEIGAARALSKSESRTALLPVLAGLEAAPDYVSDIMVLWADEDSNPAKADLIGRIDSAVRAHLAALEAEDLRVASPKIFVSHRHKDHEVARALTNSLTTAFDLSAHEVRCTSVQPFRLPFGKNTAPRLRDEIARAQVVLGILSPDTAESTYVMFELGAAWSQGVYTCPLLASGAEHGHIPGPIFDLAPARLWEEPDCHQLLDNIEAELSLGRRSDSQGAVAEKVRDLAIASRPADKTPPT